METKNQVPTVAININQRINQRSTRIGRCLSAHALRHGPHLSMAAATPALGHVTHWFGPLGWLPSLNWAPPDHDGLLWRLSLSLLCSFMGSSRIGSLHGQCLVQSQCHPLSWLIFLMGQPALAVLKQDYFTHCRYQMMYLTQTEGNTLKKYNHITELNAMQKSKT